MRHALLKARGFFASNRAGLLDRGAPGSEVKASRPRRGAQEEAGSVKIVVLDGQAVNPGDNPWDELASLGELTVYDRTRPEQILERAGAAEIVVTNKTRLDERTLGALPRLRLVTVLATGFDVVDCAAAKARGVTVTNVPDYATDSVAQHTFALILELCDRVGDHDRAVRQGRWSAGGDFAFWLAPVRELAGLTLGVVGFGRIGRRVGEIGHALGMSVLATARRPGEAPAHGRFAWAPLDELVARADVVTLHCPLTPATRGMIDAGRLALMKPTSFLVNTARGGLVDLGALAAALEHGRLAGAALDVLPQEPPPAGSPILAAPRCMLTGHMAWSTSSPDSRLASAQGRCEKSGRA
jgi:glycerate dehydrogenase